MIVKLKNSFLVVLVMTFYPSFGSAQQVLSTEVGSATQFEIASKVVNPDLKQCGILVAFPDGSIEPVVLREPDFKTQLSYSPATSGSFIISWKGEFLFNGKSENAVAGGVKQLFTNIGELVTLSKLSEASPACPGNGTVTINAESSRASIASKSQETVSPTNRLLATANIPKVMNPPIESSAFKAKYNDDASYRKMVDDFNINQSRQSLAALRLHSELGDANAQFLYGLAHLEDWTGLYDIKKACYWIRESAVQGLSQARLVLANKAVYGKECFDINPTLDQAKTWAQLASMSSDKAVKENADKLLQDILRIQFSNQ